MIVRSLGTKVAGFFSEMRPHNNTTMEDLPRLHGTHGEWQTPVKARVQSMCHDAHMTQKSIHEKTGVPTSTINRWVHETTARRVGKHRHGRPHKLNKHDVRQMIYSLRKGHEGRKLSWRKLAQECGLEVSGKTVQRALNHVGYHRCRACRKPFISRAAQQKRRKFI